MGVWKKTQCCMCGVSCGLELEVENNKIINARPDPDSPRSQGYCCRKGRAAKYFQDHGDRLNFPLKRVGDEYVRISWEQAYKEIAEKSNEILEKYGPRVFAYVGGALGSDQSEVAVAKPFMYACIGSQYLYNPIGIEFMGNWWAHGKVLGHQLYFAEPDHDSEKCEVMILWGSNSYVTHQIGDARHTIQKFSQEPDKMLIVIDPRLSETARMSDMHIMPRNGSDSLLLRAMIALILDKGWQNQKYIDKWVSDWDKAKVWYAGFDYITAIKTCQVPYEQIEQLCRILTTKRWGLHQDLGLFLGRHSTLNSFLCLSLAAICGTLLVPGGNIVQDCFAARGDTSHENDPKTWRAVETNSFPVLGVYPAGIIPAEITGTKKDHLRVMYMSKTNPITSYPDTNAMKEALSQLDLLVVSEIAMTETARLADYVLPARSGYEGWGFNTFQSTYPEITCQLKKPVLVPEGERKEDALIWIELAEAMGKMPKIPDNVYKAAEKAVATHDRIPYFMSLLPMILKKPKNMQYLVLIIGATLGRAMGSVTRSVMWGAQIISPLMGTGMVERAGYKSRNLHPIMNKIPKLKDMCLMDDVFEFIDEKPEGIVIGITDPNKALEEHIFHKDKKIHLFCEEINSYIRHVTPEEEKVELNLTAEFPMLVSSGRHSEDGHNASMRNPATYKYRDPYKLIINPEDAKELCLADGQMVKVTTKSGSINVPLECTWQTSRGYVMVPHHFGFEFQGETIGEPASVLAPAEQRDELTGNPLYRYIPCRVEAVQEVQ